MKKKIVFFERKRAAGRTIALLTAVSLCAAAAGQFGFADERSELDAINRQISSVQSQLKSGKNKVNQLSSQIKSLEAKISSTQAEINSLQGNIDATEAKISEAKAEIELLEADIFEQNEDLNARLRAMYKNGKVGFIDVLMGSNSLTDFMTNIDRVQMVYDSDKEMLENLQRERDLVTAQKIYLEQMEAQLAAQKAARESARDALQADKNEAAEERTEAQLTNEQIEAQLDALNAEADRLIEEILRLQSDGEYLGGSMMWPVPGITRITSPFGYRIHPTLKVNKLHTGVDIGCPTGTTVYAANGGKVLKSEYNGSYGNMVMVDHGGGIVTLYAHNSKLLVSAGDIVTKGQAVSISGATGRVTGPHLHFEVRVNGQYVNPLNYVTAG